ncbi:hypothetical protein GSUET_24460 [Geobacter sulfurreducens subsp. ethanolicus]|nr:hypothetical protein YM18_1159 [Geobacter sulfurreducens]BEH10834.1 hypothetical protein GSUET_24460 [Geobacter sulfurreducens subsp. ethanolicus]
MDNCKEWRAPPGMSEFSREVAAVPMCVGRRYVV